MAIQQVVVFLWEKVNSHHSILPSLLQFHLLDPLSKTFMLQVRTSTYELKSESEVAQSCLILCNPMDCTCQAPPSMGFSRQAYWRGLPSEVTLDNHSASALHVLERQEGRSRWLFKFQQLLYPTSWENWKLRVWYFSQVFFNKRLDLSVSYHSSDSLHTASIFRESTCFS